jgi:monovalent cation:H+ antiporter-2, CPA2 family
MNTGVRGYWRGCPLGLLRRRPAGISLDAMDARHGKEPFFIIAGFGLPGRTLADYLRSHHVPFCVIEQNVQTVARLSAAGVPIIAGDARDELILRGAGIERATVLAVMLPQEGDSLIAVERARRINPFVQIIARCRYVSGGLEAVRLGADRTIVAEEAVAQALLAMVDRDIGL